MPCAQPAALAPPAPPTKLCRPLGPPTWPQTAGPAALALQPLQPPPKTSAGPWAHPPGRRLQGLQLAALQAPLARRSHPRQPAHHRLPAGAGRQALPLERQQALQHGGTRVVRPTQQALQQSAKGGRGCLMGHLFCMWHLHLKPPEPQCVQCSHTLPQAQHVAPPAAASWWTRSPWCWGSPAGR
jgi:hypothetical protein